MKKLLILTLLFSSVMASGQNNIQQALEKSIKSGLYIVRQNYILRDDATSEEYTQENKDEFSYMYSLAVKTEYGYFIGELAESPWKYDENYKMFQKYTPLISKTLISVASEDQSYYEIAKDKISQYVKGQKLFYTLDSAAGPSAFSSYNSSSKNLCEVWVTVEEKQYLEKNTEIKLNFKPHNAGLKPSEQVFAGKIIGGIILNMVQCGLGKIEFQLAGIIVPDGIDWKTVMLPKQKPSTVLSQQAADDTKIKLSPIKEQQDESQQEDSKKNNDKKKKKK